MSVVRAAKIVDEVAEYIKVLNMYSDSSLLSAYSMLAVIIRFHKIENLYRLFKNMERRKMWLLIYRFDVGGKS